MMASLAYTPQPCEPLTTLVAELLRRPAHPRIAAPGERPTTDERWQDAVTQVGEQLRAKLRVEVLPDRLHKALALVLAHAVTLHPDGTASVQSGKQTYRLAPDCPCADATHRAELCQHTLAVELHRRALALLDSTALASSPTATGAPAGATPPPRAEAPPARRHPPQRTPARSASPAPTAGR